MLVRTAGTSQAQKQIAVAPAPVADDGLGVVWLKQLRIPRSEGAGGADEFSPRVDDDTMLDDLVPRSVPGLSHPASVESALPASSSELHPPVSSNPASLQRSAESPGEEERPAKLLKPRPDAHKAPRIQAVQVRDGAHNDAEIMPFLESAELDALEDYDYSLDDSDFVQTFDDSQ